MSTKVRRIDYYPDEYIAGIAGVLKADEQGVYWMVCTLIMSEGGPVDFNDRRIAGLCNIRPADARRIVKRLLELGKLSQIDGKLCQKRAQSEVERSANRIQSASESGAKGGRPRRKDQENQQTAKANGFEAEKLTTNYQLPTSNQEEEPSCPKPAKGRISYPADFEDLWKAYPTDALMSKKTAYERWKRLDDADRAELMASIPAFKAHCQKNPDYRPVHAERYISQRRFEGFAEQAKLSYENTGTRIFAGTPQWDAWRAHRVKKIGRVAYMDECGQNGTGFLVPTEWPPTDRSEQAA